MVILEFSFPAKRFHTTSWGSHVNEGVVEWPPSPWRILRALIATWHLKCKKEIPEQTMREIINELSQKPPSYYLPPASLGHTQHYMPKIEGPNEKKTKIYDTFVNVSDPIKVCWDIDISKEKRNALKLLCSRLGYLGRAESVVEATVSDDIDKTTLNSYPLDEGKPIPDKMELIRLLSPMDNGSYENWKNNYNIGESSSTAKNSGKKSTKGRSKGKKNVELPSDIFAALHCDTADLQADGWQSPPGSRFIDYVRPRHCFEVKPVFVSRCTVRPKVARFKITSSVPPRILNAISVAERIHQAILSRYKDTPVPEVFSGRGADGKPLTGHRHLHIFCEANGKRDEITHATLYAKDGFGPQERRTIESLKKVWGHGGYDIQIVLIDFGEPDSFPDCDLFGESQVWQSFTPFVATTHPRFYKDGRPKLDEQGWHIGSPSHNLRKLISENDLPEPSKIEYINVLELHGRKLHWLQFKTFRDKGEGISAGQPPAGFKITFPEKITGPLAFGYGAHFGLGLFKPYNK